MNLRQLDKKHLGRQGEPEDVVVGNSADSYLTDARGRKYIDFMMGWCACCTDEPDWCREIQRLKGDRAGCPHYHHGWSDAGVEAPQERHDHRTHAFIGSPRPRGTETKGLMP